MRQVVLALVVTALAGWGGQLVEGFAMPGHHLQFNSPLREHVQTVRHARPRNSYRDDGDYEEYDVDELGGDDGNHRNDLNVPSSFGRRDGWRLPETVSKALLAGVLVVGMALGVTLDSAINTNPRDLASRDAIDHAAPNAELCANMGASAMAFDQRVFVSFNPFNVYVSQADVKPACVLRPSNVVSVLRDRNLISDADVRSCKANMNTWAFVGDLSDKPQLSCVYQSADAQNEFLSNPKVGLGEDYMDGDKAKATVVEKILNQGNTAKQTTDGSTAV